MEPIVLATWGLVLATLLLACVSLLQYLSVRRDVAGTDARSREQLAVLDRQAEALSKSAKASQAMADEMLAARRAANPLLLRVEQRERAMGIFDAVLHNSGDRAELISRTEILLGSNESAVVVADEAWANLYLAPGGTGQSIRHAFDVGERDLLTLRVAGRPQDGLEQTREFLFRILPNGTLEDLGQQHWAPPSSEVSAIA